jgi:hypothetical protein
MTQSNRLAEQVVYEATEATTPGMWLVDLIPMRMTCLIAVISTVLIYVAVRHIPSWFPGARFKQIGREYRATMDRFVNEPHEYTKAELVRHDCCER